MSDRKERMKDLLDQLAASVMTKSEEELRKELKEAGVNPDQEITRLRNLMTATVDSYRTAQIRELPDAVPEDASSMHELLDQLMNFPGIPKDQFAGGFRDKKDLSENDLRVITENLLKLIKRRDET